MHYHFAIIGLPRSRTAWLANFFTYGRIVTCEHDAVAKAHTAEAMRDLFCRAPIAGIADSAAALVWDKLTEDLEPLRGKMRVLHVVRDVQDVSESLERCGHPVPMNVLNATREACMDVVKRSDSMEIRYADLEDVGKMERVWYFLTRGAVAWDVERWEMLKGMRVEIVW